MKWHVEEVAPGHPRFLIQRGEEILSITSGNGGADALHFDNRDDAQAIVDIFEELRIERAIH